MFSFRKTHACFLPRENHAMQRTEPLFAGVRWKPLPANCGTETAPVASLPPP
jgi:hypothetical protein